MHGRRLIHWRPLPRSASALRARGLLLLACTSYRVSFPYLVCSCVVHMLVHAYVHACRGADCGMLMLIIFNFIIGTGSIRSRIRSRLATIATYARARVYIYVFIRIRVRTYIYIYIYIQEVHVMLALKHLHAAADLDSIDAAAIDQRNFGRFKTISPSVNINAVAAAPRLARAVVSAGLSTP